MEKLKLYTVTKSSSDRIIQDGNIIWLSENGDLHFVRGCGWLTQDQWDRPETNDFEFEECQDYYLDVVGKQEIVRTRQQSTTNLDLMKKDLCDQIQKIPVAKFNAFAAMIVEWQANYYEPVIDLSKISQCDDCRALYGDCPDEGNDECDKRFVKYVNQVREEVS